MSEEQPWDESFAEGADTVRLACDVLVPLVEDVAPLRILEVGCGNGAVSRVLAAYGHDVTGIDASPTVLARARADGPGVQFEHAAPDAFAPSAPYDLVVAAFAVPAPPAHDAFIQAVGRHVSPAGQLVLIEWHAEMAPHLRSSDFTFSPDLLAAALPATAWVVATAAPVGAEALDVADPRGGGAPLALCVVRAQRAEEP